MSKTIAFVCRVVVMLTFLIAIPLIALFGKSLPDVAETVWGYWKKPAPENTWADAEEAPPFSPETISGGLVNAPPSVVPVATTMQPGANQAPLSSTVDNSSIPAAYITPSGQSHSAAPFSASAYSPSNAWPNTQSNAAPSNVAQPNVSLNVLPPDSGNPSYFADSTPVMTESAPPYGSQPLVPIQQTQAQIQQAQQAQMVPPTQPGEFEEISRRLQQLGATYYRLESWGNGQPLFRFQCRMAIVGSSGLTRQFESTDQDPAQAMRQVLSQIESWQGAAPNSNAPASTIPNASNALR